MLRDRTKKYTPEDFGELFSADEEPLIVGGQAVNIWATYYAAKSEELAQKAPFTSIDADVILRRDEADSFAKRYGWTFNYCEDFRQPMIGILEKKSENGDLLVDVLRTVLGVGPKDIEKAALLKINEGKVWKVLHPITLLKAKMTNLLQLNNTRNDGTQRQDDKQAILLVHICKQYLQEYAETVRSNKNLSERKLVEDFSELKRIIENKDFRKTAEKFSVPLAEAMPQVNTQDLPKLHNFFKYQIANRLELE
jgi:hypothetical protein